MFSHLHVFQTKKISFITGLIFALTLISGIGVTVHKVSAADTSANAILCGGFSSASDFIAKVRANSDCNGHHDLPAVYAAYGLESKDYDKFVTYSVPGTDYRDGHITVQNNGHETTVATGVKSIGRQLAPQGAGAFSQNINGTTYYGNSNDRAFAAGVSSLPVQVFFSAQGIMQFAVIKDCGNPTHGTSVVPSATCNMLNMTKSTTQANTYSFSANVSQSNPSANLFTKFVYNFGDGTSQVTTNPSTVVNHHYAKAGSFTATVTPYVKLPGNPERPIAVGGCVRHITVVLPFNQCVSLVPIAIDQSKMSYRFTVNIKYSGGATPTKTLVTFGDGQSTTVSKLSTATTYVTDHTYSKAQQYNIVATVYFANTTVVAPPCTAMVSPTAPPTPTCKPNVPVGSPECSPPCTEGSSVPPTAPQCTPPTLPKTGAGNTIAIFSAVMIGGFLIYRQWLFRKHKAAFVAAEQGTSPLPLADPLSDAPLTGTPLASSKRRSFRRKRPF